MKLKVCGIKTVAEAEVLINHKVDYVGLNFIASSSRLLSLLEAQAIMTVLKQSQVKTVALFADQKFELVNQYAEQLNVDYVQLHGNESAAYTGQLVRPVMKAISVSPSAKAQELIKFIDDYPAEHFILDRAEQGKGELVNLELAKQVISVTDKSVWLAGGLSADNLANVLQNVAPYGIDIAGGMRTNDKLDVKKLQNCLSLLD